MEFRALHPEELEIWFDHVGHVFSTPRQYFVKHWHNDPWKELEGIRVAVDDGKIVSTLRVFIRSMFLHGEPVSVGGIGEVSTHPEYRRRGLATQLLKDAIRFMEEREIAISSLHGSQRIYSVEGWESVPRYYAKKTFPIEGSAEFDTEWAIRPVDFQSQTELAQIAALYDGYSRKFNGTFVRDNPAYWNDWVRAEAPDAWVAEKSGVLEGYIAVAGKLSVREFAVSDAQFSHDSGKRLFEALLTHIIAQKDVKTFEVEYAAPIADGFNAPKINAYGSTMYRVINADNIPSCDALPALLHGQPGALAQDIRSHHVFWNTDGF